MNMMQIAEDDRKLVLNLKALLDSGDWDAIDEILDGLTLYLPTDSPEEALARGRNAGVHVGFLNQVAPKVRARRSFISLIARHQAMVDMLNVKLRSEDLLGIDRLER